MRFVALFVPALLALASSSSGQVAHSGRPPAPATAEQLAAARVALTAAEQEHGAESVAAAKATLDLARVLFRQGELGEAESSASRAVALFEGAQPDGSLDLADALLVTGACRANSHRHAAAVDCYERCLALRERLLGPADPRTILVLQNLYSSRTHSGDVLGGLAILHELVVRLERHYPEHAALRTMRTEYATVCDAMGRYADALPFALANLELVRRSHDETETVVLRERFMVGHLLCRMLDFEEGLRQFDSIAAVLPESDVSADERIYFLARRALAAKVAGRADAEQAGEQALAMVRGGIPGPNTATIATTLAAWFGGGEDRLDLCRAGVDACRRFVGDRHLNTGAALANLAQLELQAEQFATAIEHARAATAVFDLHPESIIPDRFVARVVLALCAMRKGDLNEALSPLQRNLDELPRLLHAGLPLLSDAERMDFAAGARVALDLLLNAMREAKLDAKIGLQGVLTWKGVVARGLWQELRWLREQAGEGPALQAELARLGRQTAATEAATTLDLGAFAARRQALSAALAELDRVHVPPVPAALARALAADEAYVDYVVYDDWLAKGERCCAFVVAGGAVTFLDLGPTAPIWQALAAHQELCARAVRPAGAVAVDLSRRAARRLTELVWEPIAEHVGDRLRVILCVDGALATLPFATLQSKDGSYLVERHEFVYVASGGERLAVPASAPTAGNNLCVVGNVDYGVVAAAPSVEVRAGFAPLSHSGREIAAVAAVFTSAFGAGASVTKLTGGAATTARFRESSHGARFVHVATHGFHNSTAAARMQSGDAMARRQFGIGGRGLAMAHVAGVSPGADAGIALAGANRRGGADDGVLTAKTIAWLDLTACELVTLSACETGLGTPSAGDSLVGIRRSLRLAGARRSLTTAWRIDDAATAGLMATFYRRLWVDAERPAAALRAAQLALLRQNRADQGEALPATWGAFLLEGL